MPGLVTAGATLHCTLGSSPSALVVQAAGRPNSGGHPVAALPDYQPNANIQPFGTCSSAANPGSFRGAPAPCAPAITGPWAPASPTVMTGGLPVLSTASQCHCQYGGTISVISPGQFTVTVS